ncbi:hypothetical protein DYB34_012567 [Aphanomyces astaci]|uniref:Reverse transcriptase domain-containing protein n=1 Tax=Aphanomyces astaci TaxID=112090 RepID=A0A3R6ZER0_APHAT|nr:hypothetical protein DYB34_012567 [Aphanomyces astaci]
MPKPNKLRDPVTNLRPNVLCIRKAISLLCIAHSQRYKKAFTIFGIDLSRAFDTIDHEKLLQVIEQIVKSDELRLIRMLHSDTTIPSWSHVMNPDKTEITTLKRVCINRLVAPDPMPLMTVLTPKPWRKTKKLGRRSTPQRPGPHRFSQHVVPLVPPPRHHPRGAAVAPLQLLHFPVLRYNCATWALTLTELKSFHRRQLPVIIDVDYPHHSSNAALYAPNNIRWKVLTKQIVAACATIPQHSYV